MEDFSRMGKMMSKTFFEKITDIINKKDLKNVTISEFKKYDKMYDEIIDYFENEFIDLNYVNIENDNEISKMPECIINSL